MSTSTSSQKQDDPAQQLHPFDAAALRPVPSAGVFQKLGFGKKQSPAQKQGTDSRRRSPSSSLLQAVSGDNLVRLPLAEALAISPEDETLLAIKRAHAAAAANAQGRSRLRLAHKFSTAALDLAAGNSEPTVVGLWTGGEPQWIGEHHVQLPERPAAAHDSAASGSAQSSSPRKQRLPRIAIPVNPQGAVSPEPILLTRGPPAPPGPRAEFAEFGYVSPISSSPSDSPTSRNSLLWTDSRPTSQLFSSPSDNGDSGVPDALVFNQSASGDSDGASTSSSNQEIHTPPQSSVFDLNRSSVAWSIKDPCAAGVFDEDFSIDDHSLMPLGLTLRSVRSAAVLQRRDTRNFSRPRTAPHENALALREAANREKMASLVARLKDAGVKQAKLDALVGLEQTCDGTIPAKSANSVVIGILSQCSSMKDLFSLAVVNKGFYTAFKSQELALMKNALRNQSPAAWEYRQIALESLPFTEYTPSQYLAFHTRDVYVLAALKEMLCSSRHLARDKLRSLTLEALQSRLSTRAVEIDDAFWRIWTFCELFGPEKGEEEDITAQMDWLRGGASVQASRHMARDMTSPVSPTSITRSIARPSTPAETRPATSSSKVVKFRLPPADFGLGNPGGLTNEQLEDLQEIWIGLKNLLSRISFGPERISQASEHGVFDDRPPQMDEDECLEEWGYYVLGLGLSVIEDLAAKEPIQDASVFDTAQHMGWTDWSVLESGSTRRTFLDEAVKRVSLELIAEAEKNISPIVRANTEAQKKTRKTRGQSLANELKQAKRTADMRNVPYSEERPMSLWLHFQNQEGAQLPEVVDDELSPTLARLMRPSATLDFSVDSMPQLDGLVESPEVMTPPPAPLRSASRRPGMGSFSLFPKQYSAPSSQQTTPQHTASTSRRTSAAYSPTAHRGHAASSSRSSNATYYSNSSASTGASTAPSRGASPIHEHVHPAFRSQPMRESVDEYNGLVNAAPVQENSVDCFVFRIVEMGFTADDARLALRKTDDGKCLSVDQAVEWLLSNGIAA